MRVIDGTRYMSASEYAELKNISKGRVSQLKSTLPFERFDDLSVDLINVELLELQEDEHRLLELQYSTQRVIHQYSYQQLGRFFSKLLGELTKAEETAKAGATIMEEQLNAAKSDLININRANDALTGKIEDLESQLAELQQIHQQSTESLERLQSENAQLREAAVNGQARYEQLVKQKDEMLQKLMQLQEERAQNLALIAQLKESHKDAAPDLRIQIEELKKAVSGLIERSEGKKD